MILRRLGCKKKLLPKLLPLFPQHKIYIEPFFGTGSVFFGKPKAHNNILNDLDSDVFNLFQVVMNNKKELEKAFKIMPYHSDLLEYWKQKEENEPINKALRFLFLSNFTFNGAGASLRVTATKTDYYDNFFVNLEKTQKALFGCQFVNLDFRKFLNNISFQTDGRNDEAKTFIYNDPVYLGTGSNYENQNWTEKDSFDLFEENEKMGCKYAISEFNHPFILSEAKKRNLNIINIGERQNLKNRRTEILITNYKLERTLFDCL